MVDQMVSATLSQQARTKLAGTSAAACTSCDTGASWPQSGTATRCTCGASTQTTTTQRFAYLLISVPAGFAVRITMYDFLGCATPGAVVAGYCAAAHKAIAAAVLIRSQDVQRWLPMVVEDCQPWMPAESAPCLKQAAGPDSNLVVAQARHS
jgi:hypothetical protein